MKDTNQLPEPELGYIQTDKSNQPAFSARQMREAMKQARAQVQGEPMAWLHWLHGPVRVLMNKDEAMMELDRLNREYPVDSGDRKMRPLILGDTTPQPAQATQAEVTDADIIEPDKYTHLRKDDSIQLTLVVESHAIPATRPVQAEVTDAAIDAATRHIYHDGRPTSKEYRVGIARAILALRPVQVPMKQDEAIAAIKSANISSSTTFWSIFEAGIRAAEAHHGIKPKEQA